MAAEQGSPDENAVKAWVEADPDAIRQKLLNEYIYYNHTYEEWLHRLYEQIGKGRPLSKFQADALNYKIRLDMEQSFALPSAPDPQNPTDQAA